jgi:hypothetical protein
MSDNAYTAKHDAIKDDRSSTTAANDCHAAFAAELNQINRYQSGHQSVQQAGSCSNLFTKEAEQPDALKLIPFVAVGIGHSEVEPVRLTPAGIAERHEMPHSETLTSQNPARVPEGLEAEAHLGLILQF